MRSNHILLSVLLGLALSSMLTACGNQPRPDKGGHLIGDELAPLMSSTMTINGETQSKVVLYDGTVNRIHQFNVTTNTHERSLPVVSNGNNHAVLFDQAGNYVIDLTSKSVTIFDYQAKPTNYPLPFADAPKSAAFRSGLGLLLVYNDKGTVLMMKLDQFGHIEKSTTRGGALADDTAISAGDIDETGRLILAMSDGSMAVVDMLQTINDNEWPSPMPSFSTTLKNISWVSPVRGNPNQVFVAGDKELALIDLITKTIIHQVTYEPGDVLKFSKQMDGHLLLSDGDYLKIAYVRDSKIVLKTTQQSSFYVHRSVLDVQALTWTLVSINELNWQQFDDAPESLNRELTQYQLGATDMVAIRDERLPNKAEVQIGGNSVVSLFPSKLGYAQILNIGTLKTKELKLFNVPYLE